jgi:hypothetical protein
MNTERRSRYDRKPVIGDTGKPVAAIITPRREKLLQFLLRNRYATHGDLLAYLGGDGDRLYYSLRVLRSANNSYIKLAEQTLRERNLTQKDVYELDTAGIAYLSRKGENIVSRTYTRNFTHARLASHCTGSIDAGIEASQNARLIPWNELLKSPSIPQKTRDGELAGIPIAYIAGDGEVFNKIVYADSKPFAIELTIDERRKVRFFPGVEADTGSEQITTANFLRTSIHSKFLAYQAIENDEAFKTHFGFPNFYVPFVTTDPTRLKTILAELARMGGSKTLIFQVAREEAPAGYLFKEDWQRAGHSPINLSK